MEIQLYSLNGRFWRWICFREVQVVRENGGPVIHGDFVVIERDSGVRGYIKICDLPF